MKRFIAIILLSFSLAACGPELRTQVLRITDEHVADVENLKIAAGKIAGVSIFDVYLIRDGMGKDIDKLPAESLYILDRIEELAKNKDNLSDAKKASILSLWFRFLSRNVMELLGIYAPHVLKMLGILKFLT